MSSFEEFLANMTQEAVLLIKGMQEIDHAWVSYSIGKCLDPSSCAEPPDTHRKLEPKEDHVNKLFFLLMEIKQSVESIRNIAFYVRRFPYARARIKKSAYLRYHVENYLNELYILQERLKAFTTVISRLYKNDSQSRQIASAAKGINRHFKISLNGIVRARGFHVHHYRFDDDDFSRLTLLEILSEASDDYKCSYEVVYYAVRIAKRAWIEATNNSIEQLLDIYFRDLKKLLFDNTGHLRIL